MPYRFTWAITTAPAAATALILVWIRRRGGSPEGSAPYPEAGASAGRAVVVGSDAPGAVPPDQHPGRAHQPLARDSVLPREDDPALADHYGRVVGEKTDVRRVVGRPRPAERAREPCGHRSADLLAALLVDAGLDHTGVVGVVGHERLGVVGFPRLVQAREHVENGLPVGVGPCCGGLAGHRSPRFPPRGGKRHSQEGRTSPSGEDTPRRNAGKNSSATGSVRCLGPLAL